MTTTFVLIIVAWFTGYTHGYSVSQIEFSSQRNCEIAKAAMDGAPFGFNSHPSTFCVPK